MRYSCVFMCETLPSPIKTQQSLQVLDQIDGSLSFLELHPDFCPALSRSEQWNQGGFGENMFESLKGKFDVFVAWICPIFTLGMCFCQGLSSEEKIVMSTFAKGTVNPVNAVCCSNVKASAGNTQNKQTCEYGELESERTNNRWGYDLLWSTWDIGI